MDNKKFKQIARIYARISSDRQHETSIEAQIEAMKKYCEENDMEIIGIYIDRAISGTSTENRSEFKRMMKDCNESGGDYVIVHKFDRLGRSLRDMIETFDNLQNLGIDVISVTQPLMAGNMGKLIRGLQWLLDEFYSDNLGDEVMKGHRIKAQKCLHNGGTPPLGYDVDPLTKKLIINEKEAEAVKLIYDLYLKGYGYNKIAQELNQKGYRTKEGNYFTHNSFHDLLRNKKYCGYYVYNLTAKKLRGGKRNKHKHKNDDEVISIKGGVPAIISEETYNKVLEKMEKNRHKQGAYSAKRLYMLSGLIRCGECGCAMQGDTRKSGKGYITNSYRCKHHNKTQCCNKEIKQELIENYVMTLLQKTIFCESSIPLLLQGIRESLATKDSHVIAETKRIDDTIRGKKKRITHIKNAVMNGFAEEDFIDDLAKLKSDVEALEEQRRQLPPIRKLPDITEEMLRNVISNFSERLKKRNTEDCKRFISEFVDSVIIYKDKVDVNLKLSPAIDDYTISRSVNRQFLPNPNKTQNNN